MSYSFVQTGTDVRPAGRRGRASFTGADPQGGEATPPLLEPTCTMVKPLPLGLALTEATTLSLDPLYNNTK